MNSSISSSGGNLPLYEAGRGQRLTSVQKSLGRVVASRVNQDRSTSYSSKQLLVDGLSYGIGAFGTIPFVKSSARSYDNLPILPNKEITIAATFLSQWISGGYYLSDSLKSSIESNLDEEALNILNRSKSRCKPSLGDCSTIAIAAVTSLPAMIMDQLNGGGRAESWISFFTNAGLNHGGAKYFQNQVLPGVLPRKLSRSLQKKWLSAEGVNRLKMAEDLEEIRRHHLDGILSVKKQLSDMSQSSPGAYDLVENWSSILTKEHLSAEDTQGLIAEIQERLKIKELSSDKACWQTLYDVVRILVSLSAALCYSGYVDMTAKGLSDMVKCPEQLILVISTLINLPLFFVVMKSVIEFCDFTADGVQKMGDRLQGRKSQFIPHWLNERLWLTIPFAMSYILTFWSAPYYISLSEGMKPDLLEQDALLGLGLSVYMIFNTMPYNHLFSALGHRAAFKDLDSPSTRLLSLESVLTHLAESINEMNADDYADLVAETFGDDASLQVSDKSFGAMIYHKWQEYRERMATSQASQTYQAHQDSSVSSESNRMDLPLRGLAIPV